MFLGGFPLRFNRPPRTLPARSQGFTLIELLIVVAIIGILATMLLSAIFGAKTKTQVGVAKSQIKAIQAALSMYEGDHGKFPRHTARPTGTAAPAATHECWNDDAAALYMALRNRPTVELGGGQNSPYLDWKAEATGIIPRANLAVGYTNADGSMSSGAQPLPPDKIEEVNKATFQQLYKKTATQYLVLLDPWGNPYHYREWGSIRQSIKDAYMNNPSATRTITAPAGGVQSGSAPIPGPVTDNMHSPETYDIWSNGPNGVNEWGAPGSDDVTSWGQ